MSKTSEKAKNAWNMRNYDQVLISVRKGDKDRLKAAAAAENVSVSRFIVESINTCHPGLLAVLDDESKKKRTIFEERPENDGD